MSQKNEIMKLALSKSDRFLADEAKTKQKPEAQENNLREKSDSIKQISRNKEVFSTSNMGMKL